MRHTRAVRAGFRVVVRRDTESDADDRDDDRDEGSVEPERDELERDAVERDAVERDAVERALPVARVVLVVRAVEVRLARCGG